MAETLLGDAGQRALALVEESNGFHDRFVEDCDRRWREFEGRMDAKKEQSFESWQSKLHPPYLNHIVETQLAGLLDERFSFRVSPAPRLFNPGEFASAKRGAKAHEILIRQQLKEARFNDFQRPFALDAAVCGIGVAKTFWRSEMSKRKRNVVVNATPPELARFMFIPDIKPVERVEGFDGPMVEALDPRDCYWHEGATSLEKSRFFAHAIWMTYADLMALAKQGVYEMEACRALEGSTEDSGAGDGSRESRGRRRDMLEILEIWDRELRRVTTVGARAVQLRDKPWPYWHGRYPFQSTSLQPRPRALRGMSVVEKLAHLQEMVWSTMNNRHDNLSFINNFISILRADVDDPDAFPFEPGATWFLEDPAAVTQWAPSAIPAEVSLGAEAILKQDMQNLAGSQPFTSTSEARGVGADTATEAALVTNLAQMATKQMKSRLYGAYELIGQDMVELNQQFIREPVYADKIGLDNEAETVEILPHLLAPEVRFDIAPMNESLNRSERRAEANGRFQMFMQAAPVLAALGVNLNYKALTEDVFEAWDEPDKERYFAVAPPPAPPAAPGQPAQNGAAPPGGPGGVTAPQSIDPAVSPSNQSSIAPSVFQSRALASQGGVSNT